ncbi:homeobox protein 2-like [Uloborus diversus]|uniref:homeobox protein 2-like n=1 Tax=Uloborus diversus TaxID=327109 RepID=UPI0024095E47|nr:homeobox protein 2-like [Uloborus diversus]
MNQRQELIEGKDVYNVPEQMNSYSLEQYPDQKNQYQEASLAHNTDNSEIEKLTSNSSSTGQNSSTTLSKKQKKKHRNSQKNRGKAKKQKNKKPSSAKQVHGENERSMDYSTSYSNQQQGTSSEQNTYEPENGRKVETTNSEAYSVYSLPSTKAPSKNRSNSSTKAPSKNRSNSSTKIPSKNRSNSQKKDEKSKKQNISTATPYQTVTNSDFASNDNISPKTQGFQGLSNRFYSKMKALELGKIIFVVLSKNELFSKTFNKDITNIDAQLLAFQIVSRGMKQCGYFNISDDIAQSCTQAICSVKEGSSSQVYSQALAKAIALYFHKNQLLQDDSENQAKDVALAIIQFLPDERKLYDYNAQDQKQPTSYANSPSEVNNYPFDTYTENSPSEDSKLNAENTNGMHAQNYNTKYTEMEKETNGENIRSHSSEENYVNENNINDKEVVDYDESNDENDEQDQAGKSYDQDNINTIRIGPTADETDYECDKTAESGEYNNLNDARGDSTESNEKGDYDDESNNENYDDADTNFKNSNTKIIAMADADVGTDYEFDETENDDYKYNDDRTQDDTPSNYDISTANESKTYGTTLHS